MYKGSEYDQEIPHSQTADKLNGTVRKSYMTFTVTRHQIYNKSKSTTSLFLIKMIAKLEMT